MKSLGKLRKFALHKGDSQKNNDHRDQGLSHLDELAQASEDMQDMRNCYDNLLSAAAATANSAYEFSESLLEMGTCLMEKTGLHDDGESGRVLLRLGQVQLELQKLVDAYRSHITLTITNPSECLLSELRKVEEMKLQCDEKREAYEYMMAQQKEKGGPKSGKGESFSSRQLQTARYEYDEVARLCVFRVESLKQGQCRSLLAQAARHHAAQLNLFRKGLKSLKGVDPHVRHIAEKQHIDYQVNGLDGGERGENEVLNSQETNDDGELSFDYRQNKQGLDNACTSRNSMEVDVPYSLVSKIEVAEINLTKNQEEHVFSQQPRVSSHSAPIFAEKFDPSEKIRELQPSIGELHTYVLPTPVDVKSSAPRMSTSITHSSPTHLSGSTHNLWHSSPLDGGKHERNIIDDTLPVSTSKAQSSVKESNNRNSSARLPLPPEGLAIQQSDVHNTSDTKKYKRQAFSGPLASKPWSNKLSISTSGPITSTELPHINSGLHSRIPVSHPSSSSNVSRSASPPLISSPRISELHQLPLPPGSFASKAGTSFSVIGNSAPLFSRNQEFSSTNKSPSRASVSASPLPAPPLTVPRSFSIPSRNQRAKATNVAKVLESPQIADKTEAVASPPLSPISLSNMRPLSSVSELTPDFGQVRGGS